MRTPILLYRCGLGRVMGRHLLMLEHLGRVSGSRRYVVLEVVGETEAGGAMVVSGFGRRSQWYRNLVAHPEARIWWSRSRPRVIRARELDEESGRQVVAAYARRHPSAWRRLSAALEVLNEQPVELTRLALPVLALDMVPSPESASLPHEGHPPTPMKGTPS